MWFLVNVSSVNSNGGQLRKQLSSFGYLVTINTLTNQSMNIANYKSQAKGHYFVVGIVAALLLWGATAVPAQAQTQSTADLLVI